jgi:hypothetical protein
MDKLGTALNRRKERLTEEPVTATLALVGKGLAKGAMVAAKAGAKAAKVGAKAGAKGAKAGGKAVKSGTKVVNPKVMGGEVKKSAQIAKNVKPKSGPTIDVKATEVGGEVAKSKKATMASKSSTPKTKYGKSKGGEIQKSQKGEITNKGKNQVDPQKNPEAEKPKDEPKVDDKPKTEKKKKGKNPDVVGAVSRAYGKTSFAVKEQITFREWLDQLPVDEL